MKNDQRRRLTEWCEALESGKYSQSRGELKKQSGYCCLGVAVDLLDPDGWTQDGGVIKHRFGASYYQDVFYKYQRNVDTAMNEQAMEMYGITINQQMELYFLNDTGENFCQIASYIRREILHEEIS